MAKKMVLHEGPCHMLNVEWNTTMQLINVMSPNYIGHFHDQVHSYGIFITKFSKLILQDLHKI